jgi:hypothetical protein
MMGGLVLVQPCCGMAKVLPSAPVVWLRSGLALRLQFILEDIKNDCGLLLQPTRLP